MRDLVLLCCLTVYYLMYHFYCSSESHSEYKLDSTCSKDHMSEVVREQDDEEEFLEELSDNDDDDNELQLLGEHEDDVSLTSELSEPTDEAEISVRCALTIWQRYRPRLVTNVSRVAYLCSPHPLIIAHSEDIANRDPENAIAVEQFIERVLLPQKCLRIEDRPVELARMIDKFWSEREDFVKRRNYFARANIWIIAALEDTLAYEWHKRYSCPCTEILGPVACKSTSEALGCGQAERHWKSMKAQITGKRAKLGSEKAKKQSVISAAFARQKNELHRKHAQRAGVLWTDEDFEFCKLDHYCSGSLVEELVVEPSRVFHSYLEDWEDVQFGRKGDDIHAARVSAKYGGLMFYDADYDRVGMFREIDCAILTKCVKKGEKKTRTQKVGNGKGYFYTVLGTYAQFDPQLKLECQSELLFDMFERYWDFYEMISDYYSKNPDPNVRIVTKERDEEDGRGKQPANDGMDEDSSDEEE